MLSGYIAVNLCGLLTLAPLFGFTQVLYVIRKTQNAMRRLV